MTIEITPAAPAAAPVPASDTPPVVAQTDANAANPAPVESKEQPQQAAPAADPQKEERRKSAQQRINELTAQKHEFRRVAEDAARENALLRKQLEELSADPNSIDDVSRMRAAVKSEKLEDTYAKAQQAQQMVSALRAQSFAANVDLVRETVPDIDQALSGWFNMPLAEAAQDLIAESENGALVAYHLARNPHIQARINTLPPHMIGREIARIEAQIAPYPVKRISQAPPPVQTVSGNAATGAPDPEKMDQRTYEKWRESQMRA